MKEHVHNSSVGRQRNTEADGGLDYSQHALPEVRGAHDLNESKGDCSTALNLRSITRGVFLIPSLPSRYTSCLFLSHHRSLRLV